MNMQVTIQLPDAETTPLELSKPPANEPIAQATMVFTGTFTSEPISEAIEFWAQELQLPLRVSHSPYGQLFQELLNPKSQFRCNERGANVVLLRLEDRLPAEHSIAGFRPLAGVKRRRLPNGLEIAHLNEYETDYLYQEILADRVYLRHGITIEEGDCVFDVGANIGMFSLFARMQAPDVEVYAFEPSPRTAAVLQANAVLAGGVNVFECGISDGQREAEFTFYKNSSVFSSFHADSAQDEAAVRAVVNNMLERAGVPEGPEREQAIRYFMEDRLEAEPIVCGLRSLSDVIDEYGVEQIDLLKIDAEKSEWDVLMGLRGEHWARIRQIVMEVHDRTGEITDRITALLRQQGFDVESETEQLLTDSGLHTVYARRPGRINRGSSLYDFKLDEFEKTVDDLIAALKSAASASRVPVMVVCCPPSPELLLRPEILACIRNCEQRLNEEPGLHIIRAEDILTLYPTADLHDARARELGHIPYTPDFYAALGTYLVRTFLAIQNAAVKVICVDADDTLWSGVCGEVGPAGVRIESGRQQFQRLLADRVAAGKLLAVCSKNSEDDVLGVFAQNQQMQLSLDHVTAWRVNWRNKSENIRDIAKELNVGLDSFVFLDDNPLECAEVGAHAPGVIAIQTPAEADKLGRFAQHLWLLDQFAVTEEDRRRSALYAQNAERERFRDDSRSLEEFLAGLKLQCDIQPLREETCERASQLTHRTNQLNLCKQPYSPRELANLVASPETECFTVSVSDRFGDYGLVGVLLYSRREAKLLVEVFLLSCRALGRGVEQRMLAEVARRGEACGANTLELPFVASDRNQPMKDFLSAAGARFDADSGRYFIDCGAAQRVPAKPASSYNGNAYDPPPSKLAASPGYAGWTAAKAVRVASELSTVEQIQSAISAWRRSGSQREESASSNVADPLRRRLCEIFAAVLHQPSIAPDDDFYSAGGSSLQLVQAVSRAWRELDIAAPPEAAFRLRTVESLAAWIGENEGPTSYRPPNPARSGISSLNNEQPTSLRSRLGYNQQALWYLYQLSPRSWAYNIPFGARCNQRLDGFALRAALEQLLSRHHLLDTIYVPENGKPSAKYPSGCDPDFVELDYSDRSEGELSAYLREECRRPFDLRGGPVSRLRLLHISADESVVLFVTHHIAVDLWSMELIVDDLFRLYQGARQNKNIPHEEPSGYEYSDFVHREHELLESVEGDDLWDYWQEELAGTLPVLNLQFGKAKPQTDEGGGRSHVFDLGEELTADLSRFAKSRGLTIFQVLLASYFVLLYRHTAQTKILIGSPFSCRDLRYFGDVVGDFANLVPLGADLSGSISFTDLLKQLSGTIRSASEHQSFPFSLLVKRLGVQATSGRMPLVQTSFAVHEPQVLPHLGMFFLQGNTEGILRLHGLELAPAGLTQQEGQFDLAMEIVPFGPTLRGALKYKHTCFDQAVVEQLAIRFKVLLAAALSRPDDPVDILPLFRAATNA
jgi:FkbH-like protein/FkbM family methyltransferase